MEYRNVGRSGLQVSAAGLGCNNFGMRIDKEQTAVVVNRALDLGVNLFDTANIYGGTKSEEFLGAALGDRRKNVVVATKFVGPAGEGPLYKGASRAAICRAVEDSLRRLDTDWIDLYQIHFPDVSTPIEETLRALEDLVRQGKVLYYGCSNFAGWQVVEAQAITRDSAPLAADLRAERVQLARPPHRARAGARLPGGRTGHSAVLPARERLPQRQVPPGREAAGGHAHRRLGRPRRRDPLRAQLRGPVGTRALRRGARGKTVLDVAIGWLASHPYVPSVIAGATKPEQVEQNVKAAEWRLTPEEMSEIDAITKRRD